MLIDTHAHLAHPLLSNTTKVIEDANNAGVQKIISIGCSIDETKKNLGIIKSFPEIKTTAGLYPIDDRGLQESRTKWRDRLSEIERIINENKTHIVAIGECGLDYSDPSPTEILRDKSEQIELFLAQIDLARKVGLPVIVHSRNATNDTLEIIISEQRRSPFKVVWHCFNENYEVATKLLDVGAKISVNGIFTYKSAQDLRDCMKKIPLDSFMLETDAPYLLPLELKRASVKVNSPQYVRIISNAIAEELNIDAAMLDEITTKTAVSFFNL